MKQRDIHTFLLRFFQANQCDILEESAGHMTVQLTIDMDKLIMNRPFYWHWLEKTGGVPEPRQLTLITDQKKWMIPLRVNLSTSAPLVYSKFLKPPNSRADLSVSMNESPRSWPTRSHSSPGLVSM